MGNLWDLKKAFWTLMLLPMVPNITFSSYGSVPLLPYLERKRPPLCGKDRLSLELVFATLGGQNGLSRGLDLTPSEALTAVPNSTPMAASAPSGARIDLIGTRSCILPCTVVSEIGFRLAHF
jgi:hypothetical protein